MKKILLALPVLVLLISCDKDDDDDSQGKTKTELLTQQAWKLESIGTDADNNGTIEQSISGSIDDCIEDNTLKFETNGTGVMDEGANVCAGASQTTDFTWSFANNETVLNLSGGAAMTFSGQYNIYALEANRLALSKDTTLPFVGTVRVLANFKH